MGCSVSVGLGLGFGFPFFVSPLDMGGGGIYKSLC